MKKNWYENIPPHGVLCKNTAEDGEVIHVLSYNAENDYLLSNKIDFEGDKEIFYPSDLTPLTVQEIWQFMTWQKIDLAPTDNDILILCGNGNIESAFHVVGGTWQGRNSGFNYNPKKWLPMPVCDL
jgi:hypothetical protein